MYLELILNRIQLCVFKNALHFPLVLNILNSLYTAVHNTVHVLTFLRYKIFLCFYYNIKATT